MRKIIPDSELILRPDGAIYHLNLQPEDIADTIILVGDPERVGKVSQAFDHIELKKGGREFLTHTGMLGQKRISVVSTGIGCDNIDIVLNELNALANIDLKTRQIKPTHKSLDMIRLGTSGGLQPDIPVGQLIVSDMAIGLNNFMHFYQQPDDATIAAAETALHDHFPTLYDKIRPFISRGNPDLQNHFSSLGKIGHTITCSGFYAPQGRELIGKLAFPNFIEKLTSFSIHNTLVENFEMETAAIYGLGHLLGHRCCSISLAINNRVTGVFTDQLDLDIANMIDQALTLICQL